MSTEKLLEGVMERITSEINCIEAAMKRIRSEFAGIEMLMNDKSESALRIIDEPPKVTLEADGKKEIIATGEVQSADGRADRKENGDTLLIACERLLLEKARTTPGVAFSPSQIRDELVKQGLYEFSSLAKTPEASISSRLTTAIKEGNKNIVKLGRGLYAAAA